MAIEIGYEVGFWELVEWWNLAGIYTHERFFAKTPFWGGKLAVRPLKKGIAISSRENGHKTAKQGPRTNIWAIFWLWETITAEPAKICGSY